MQLGQPALFKSALPTPFYWHLSEPDIDLLYRILELVKSSPFKHFLLWLRFSLELNKLLFRNDSCKVNFVKIFLEAMNAFFMLENPSVTHKIT